MAHSNQGIVKDDKGQEQPADKRRAQTVHKDRTREADLARSDTRPEGRGPRQDAGLRHGA